MSTIKSFSDLRKQSSVLASLQKNIKASSGGFKKEVDTRFWQPTKDKSGNASTIIRFLPAPMGEEQPWQKLYSHYFQGPTGKWFINNCPSTLGLPSPVYEMNKKLYDSGSEEAIKQAKNQKRNTNYYANILVIKDPLNPETESNVYLFKFGAKIFDKIKSMIAPEFDDEKPVNVFDFWEGANFKLKVGNVAGYVNYDKSSFDNVSVIANSDAEIEAIWKKQHSLVDFVKPENFKTYSELKAQLETVTSTDGQTASTLGDKMEKVTQQESVGEEIEDTLAGLSTDDLEGFSDFSSDDSTLDDFDDLLA